MVIGKFRSGKDAFYDIAAKHVEGLVGLAHADILKRITDLTLVEAKKVMEAYGIPIDEEKFAALMKDKAGKRPFLIDFGTGVMRKEGKDTMWLDLLVDRNKEVFETGDYIIKDTRFVNEYEYHRKAGVIPVLINCSVENLKKRYFETCKNGTEESFWDIYDSETEQLPAFLQQNDEFYIEIDNNGTLEDYENQIINLLKTIS